MSRFIKTELTLISKSDFEVEANIMVAKGYARTGDSIYANDYLLVGHWSDGNSSVLDQRGGWVSYCEITH